MLKGFDHWKTGGDNPGITEAQDEREARESYEERRLDQCQRCGKRDLLTRLTVLVCPQTHESPAEYEELSLCMKCTPADDREQ